MIEFNDKAKRAEAEETPLAGYMGFSFGESQRDNPSRYAGMLIDRALQKTFVGWKPDCVVYTAQFDMSKNLPAEEMQREAIIKFFKEQGATVLKATIKIETDVEEMGHPIRAIAIQLPLEDAERVRKAILALDAACNGFYTKRQKAKTSQPSLV